MLTVFRMFCGSEALQDLAFVYVLDIRLSQALWSNLWPLFSS